MDLQHWLTPEGVKTIVELLVVLMSAVTAALSLLGYRKQAVELETAKDTIETHEQTIANATKTAVALVTGVQTFRDNAAPEHADALKQAIMDATKAFNVEHIVLPLVKAVTEGQGNAQSALVQPTPQPVKA
jgi:methylthioribose-1-phosphate isomerase